MGKLAQVAKEIAQVREKPAQVTEKTTRNQLKVGIILPAF